MGGWEIKEHGDAMMIDDIEDNDINGDGGFKKTNIAMVDVDTPHPFEGPQSSLENAAARFSRGDSSSYSHLWQQVTIRTCPCVFWIFNSMKLFVA